MSIDYKNNADYERQEARNAESWKVEADNYTHNLYNRVLSLRDSINIHLDIYSHHLEDEDYDILYKIVEAIEEQIPIEIQQDYKEQA